MCTNGDFYSSLHQQRHWSAVKIAGRSGDARDLIDPDGLSSQPDVIQQAEEADPPWGQCVIAAGRGGRSELADETTCWDSAGLQGRPLIQSRDLFLVSEGQRVNLNPSDDLNRYQQC